MRIFFFLSLAIFLLFSCKNELKVTRAGYVWDGNLYEDELKAIDTLSVSKIYFKLFEVDYSVDEGIVPRDKNFIDEKRFPLQSEIVPCIYILNSVFVNISEDEFEETAENILFLLNKRMKPIIDSGTVFQEIQLDCDWTKSTKDKYFKLIQLIKEKSQKEISCTLRLYPYKFRKEMGVPPCDRVMLMCYNLTNPMNSENSIYSTQEFKKYIESGKGTYPLPMDFALPIYSNGFEFHLNELVDLNHGISKELKTLGVKEKGKKGLWYTAQMDTFFRYPYIFLKAGDQLKLEFVEMKDLDECVELIQENIAPKGEFSVALYHFDNGELKNWSYEELDSIYLLFNQ